MSFPAEKPYNPPVSSTPILGPSSGNPKSFQDPKSVASVGNTIQAMSDQAAADTLYDTPVTKLEGFRQGGEGFRQGGEGFRNEVYSPWILRTESCSKKEGFASVILNPSDYKPHGKINFSAMVVAFIGIGVILMSFSKSK